MHTQYKKLQIIIEMEGFHGGLTPHEIWACKMMSGQSKKLEMGHPKIKKKHKKIQNWLEIGLHVSYRAQNLHAEIFLVVIRWLYRPKVPKVSKINDFDDFLSRCWRSSGADSMAPWVLHSGLGRCGDPWGPVGAHRDSCGHVGRPWGSLGSTSGFKTI